MAFLFDLLDLSLIHPRYPPVEHIISPLSLSTFPLFQQTPLLNSTTADSKHTSHFIDHQQPPLEKYKPCTPARISHEDVVVESILKVQNARTVRYVVGTMLPCILVSGLTFSQMYNYRKPSRHTSVFSQPVNYRRPSHHDLQPDMIPVELASTA